ncbi:MAG: Holliday junction resolvase RuvX [Actinomycetota bacterium]|nr:Holliday junction resolvase RuvX [Actinomycetota bacterium]
MILGVDPGGRRVGIAVADIHTRLARPLEVIDSKLVDPVARITSLASQLTAKRIVVGRPTSLAGTEGPAVAVQQDFVARLREASDVEVEEWDERLTTVIAEQQMRAGGASAETRKQWRDAVAAQVMLQSYMDAAWH